MSITYLDCSADISECGTYRYSLRRIWDWFGATCLFMLNPSTADGRQDDPTIRRCVSFARREGCGSLEVVNLFAYRATQPTDMKAAADPVGPWNDSAIRAAVDRASVMIAAWGVHGGYRDRDTEIAAITGQVRVLRCLGTTKDGHPRHPLYVASDESLRIWNLRNRDVEVPV